MCQNYKPLPDYKPTMYNPLLNLLYDDDDDILEGANKLISPFLASGDLQPFDSIRSETVKVTAIFTCCSAGKLFFMQLFISIICSYVLSDEMWEDRWE